MTTPTDPAALSQGAASGTEPEKMIRRQLDAVGKLLMGYVMACQAAGERPSPDVIRATGLLSLIEIPAAEPSAALPASEALTPPIESVEYQARSAAENRPCGVRWCVDDFPGMPSRWCSGCLISVLLKRLEISEVEQAGDDAYFRTGTRYPGQ